MHVFLIPVRRGPFQLEFLPFFSPRNLFSLASALPACAPILQQQLSGT